jgi:hypothetical protein
MKYWEIIGEKLNKTGWSWGYVSSVDSHGHRTFIADAHCGDGNRYVIRADEMLTALMELEATCLKATPPN